MDKVICLACGWSGDVSQLKIVRSDSVWFAVCPKCESYDLSEDIRCVRCAKRFTDEDLLSGFCHGCLKALMTPERFARFSKSMDKRLQDFWRMFASWMEENPQEWKEETT